MNKADFDRLLVQTLADRKLSQSEKRALSEGIAALATDEQQLAYLRSRAFVAARNALTDPQAKQILDWLEDVVKLFKFATGAGAANAASPASASPSTASAYFSPGPECVQQLQYLFSQTRQKADICVFTITDDRIARGILDMFHRGVSVRIISDNDKSFDIGSDIDELRRAGIPVRLDKTEYHMHHKFAIFDGKTLVNGSYNWTRGAAEYNEENIIVTTDPGLVQRFQAVFDRLWQAYA
jgi:phosphatidylserine/phosphatidylglycerophosphate/cardiolipin synthase-like enzyme